MIAQRGDVSLAADGPVALLGLITLIALRGEEKAWTDSDVEIDNFVDLFGSAQ